MALITCPQCGRSISNMAKSCVHCGFLLVSEHKTICPECGAEIAEDSSACGTCGYPIQETANRCPTYPTQPSEVTGKALGTETNERETHSSVSSPQVSAMPTYDEILQQVKIKHEKTRKKRVIIIVIIAVFLIVVGGIIAVVSVFNGNNMFAGKQKSLREEGTIPATKTVEPIQLTRDNINNYINMRGEYKNGDYHKNLFYYVSTADLEFQAYSTVPGSFDNVEITVRVDLSDKDGQIGENWHIVNSADESKVEFTFKMPSNGQYNSSYSIECNRSTWKLSGNSKLAIVSVSGTYIPNN